MNNKAKIGIIGIVLLVIVAALFFMGDNPLDAKKAHETFVSENWEDKYKLNEKDPYGLFMFNQLLRAHVDTNQTIIPLTNSVELDSVMALKQRSTMLFVGDKFGLKTAEFDSVLAQVHDGNTLLLSSNQLTENIVRRLFIRYEVSYDYADSVNVNINNNTFSMFYLYQNDTIAHEWRAFLNVQPIDSTYRKLSTIFQLADFIRLKHGKGFIYLHTNPEFFFNYQVKRNEGFRYTSFLLNQLPQNQPVYILELGRLLEFNYDPYGEGEGNSDKQDDSYFQFILKSPALIAAFGLGLLGVLLFVLFRSKRMQPVVPYIEKKKNMSLEFAQTITSIYQSKSNPMGIVKVQRQNFYDAMQKRFFIDISGKANDREKAITILSEKSTIPVSEINELIVLFEPVNPNALTDLHLAQIAEKQRSIYMRVNIITERIIERIEGKEIQLQRNLLYSVLLILLGIFVVMLGFYYLVASIGIGIVLWPIGALFLGIGIRRINRSYLIIRKDELVMYQSFGKKRIFLRIDLMRIAIVKNAYIMYFKDAKELKINKLELSKFDKSQLERFISKHHQIPL
jgi:hypothetical protein